VVTGLLAVPLVLMAPEEQASQEPGGPVFDLQKKVNDRFRPRIHITSVIIEDRERDILRQEPLWELYLNEEALRRSELGPFLYNGYDPDNERQIFGVFTIADAVQGVLRLDPSVRATLETATDGQVKQAIHRILESPTGEPMRDSLSKDASFELRLVDGREIKYWRAEALSAFVASDNQKLGGGPLTISPAGDEVTLGKERFNRRVQEILRGDQSSFRLWGIAIDINLESEEQGRTAVPFIAATVVLVLAVVGLTLRSVRVVGLTFLALIMLLVAASNFFGAVFSRLGTPMMLTDLLLGLDLSPMLILAIIMAVIFLLGWPLEWVPIVLIIVPILLPLVDKLGFNLTWFGILVAINLQTAWLSPPVALSAYFLKGVVPEWDLKDIYAGMMQFMVIQMIGLLCVMFFPQIALWLPELIYGK